ncbi:MAG: DUF3862 domain-containing protein [Lactobacillus crispatus]|jgi:hypothetical protein|nr:DUF3862 domain-containing protein [Lactobacillus crispatus]MCI1364401.1 DUF3862 domain-containing protein [Lactobacillus crispatus]MCI1537371.1 DUF3862 domain-containing protein [Lactobacillus crispatus]
MKLKKVALITATVIAGLSLSACSSSNNENGSAKSTQTSKKKSSSTDKIISQNKELRSKFDQIKVGDLMSKGKGGDTEKQVKALLGSSNSTTSSKTEGIKTSGATWNKGKVSITVAYVDKHAISKMITGFKWTGRPAKLDKKAFDSIADGSTYESVIKKYGEPDGLDESLIMGKKTVAATWITGVKGDTGANAVLTFTNNKLTDKTQTDLK